MLGFCARGHGELIIYDYGKLYIIKLLTKFVIVVIVVIVFVMILRAFPGYFLLFQPRESTFDQALIGQMQLLSLKAADYINTHGENRIFNGYENFLLLIIRVLIQKLEDWFMKQFSISAARNPKIEAIVVRDMFAQRWN
jgi:hypothetical protein